MQLRLDTTPVALHLAEPVPIHEIETKTTEGINHMNDNKIVMTAADHAELNSVVALASKVSTRMKF
jgi:hypothetical protein